MLEKERKKGFGKKLLDYVVNYAKDNGYEYVLWRTQSLIVFNCPHLLKTLL